ncbi:ABC transporter [Methylobacterium sp. C25]|nr:ABC transporter [Methylobacterium sp. C25]
MEVRASQLRQPSHDSVDAYLRVISALMLRDMRTRFFGSYWGYVAQVLWPVAHMFIISGALVFRKVPAPFGDSVMIFAASGAVPALAFQYIAREMMKGILLNRPLIYYPQVKAFDVMISRATIEIIGSLMGVIIIFVLLLCLGINPIPENIPTAISGYLCAVCLGIGIGTVNCAIVQFFPGWLLGFIGINILLYISAGVFFLATDFPSQIYGVMKWNPILQLVEWVRLGYDPSLPIEIDYIYMFMWVFGSLTFGLLLERTVSRRSS